MFDVFLRMYGCLTRGMRRQLWVVQGVSILVAATQVVGIAAVVPFLAVVGDPSRIKTSSVLRWLYTLAGSPGDAKFLMLLGAGMVLVIVAANAISVLGLYLGVKLAYRVGNALSIALFRYYLHRDYLFHTRTGVSLLLSRVHSEVDRVTRGVLFPMIQVGTSVVQIFVLTAALVAVDAGVATVTVAVFGGAYVGITFALRSKMRRWGWMVTQMNRCRVATIREGFGAIKELIVNERQEVFLDEYSLASKRREHGGVMQQLAGNVPRNILEVLGFCGIVLASLLLVSRGSRGDLLPKLSFFALAGYRLLPAVQNLFLSMALVRSDSPVFEDMEGDLQLAMQIEQDPSVLGAASADIASGGGIRLTDVKFWYESEREPALDGVSLEISVPSTVGFVGATGSGKTTTADVILGLLSPQSGEVFVGGVVLTEGSVRSWRRHLSYVPQQIYLLDASIAENIALGVPRDEIDYLRVREAAALAQAASFIERLPEGYEETVGENGVQLSGGQRQRIGIARALYRDSPILVLDEATSALDGDTEAAVMAESRDYPIERRSY